jgi:hypothetical protein
MGTVERARFKDSGEWIESFGEHLLVSCPRCQGCANTDFANKETSIERACVCVACGYSDKRLVHQIPAYSYTWRVYERLHLWLQTPCCRSVLWALNEKHLVFLESYVSATIRERRPSAFGWSNHSLAGRLPQWITAARNREEVMRGLRRLRLRLPRAE